MATPNGMPRAPLRGGDTLAIWRWQGKASRGKALTLLDKAGALPTADLIAAISGQSYKRAAAQASRNCRFITLPLALRGSGSVVRSIVSGTL
jgi:hypothetical protein